MSKVSYRLLQDRLAQDRRAKVAECVNNWGAMERRVAQRRIDSVNSWMAKFEAAKAAR